jgi:hypothetical protein
MMAIVTTTGIGSGSTIVRTGTTDFGMGAVEPCVIRLSPPANANII